MFFVQVHVKMISTIKSNENIENIVFFRLTNKNAYGIITAYYKKKYISSGESVMFGLMMKISAVSIHSIAVCHVAPICFA